MGSALQGAMASAQLTTDAMAGVARMVTSTLDRATKERQLQSNILEGMVRSAQNAKQMEIDSFFKGQELKLREKELSIDSQFKNIQLGMDNSRLTLAERQLELQEDKFRLEEEKIVEADKYKPYLKVLSEEAAMKDRELKAEERFLNEKEQSLITEIHGREKSGTNPEIRGMTTKQKLDDQDNPNGKIAELKKIQTERRKALEAKRIELDDINRERENVSQGNSPGVFRPLPKIKSTSSNNTSGDMEMGIRRTSFNTFDEPSNSYGGIDGVGLDPSLFPRESYPKLPKSASQKDKNAVAQIDAEMVMLEGQLPQDDYQNDLSPEDESKIIAKKDQRYISSIFDPSVPLDEVPELIDALSPKGKADLEMKKGVYESGFLADYGASKSFDFSKPYNPDSKASEQMSEMYARSGGNPIELNLLKAEAETKLITLRSEANAKAAVNPDDTTFSVDTFVANGYNKWVSDRLVKQEEVAKDNASNGLKTGSIIAPDGSLPGERSIASTETKDESLDDLLGKYTVSADNRKIKEAEDKDIEIYDQFSKGFIKTSGGFDRRTFAETALQQPALLYAVLGNERINLESSEVGYSDKEVEDVTNANYRKLIEKVNKLQAPDAFRMWKEASKFIK